MALIFANNAVSLLAVTALLSADSLTVAPGEGARFPAPVPGESFILTVQEGSLFEIMECTARTGDVLTVTRGIDDTAAQTWSVGASVTCRGAKAVWDAMLQKEQALALYVPLDADIVLPNPPTLPAHATRKDYVDSAVTTVNNAIAAKGVQIGSGMDWWGHLIPPGYLLADGRPVSRSTYALLFSALTFATTVQMTAGQPTVTIVAGNPNFDLPAYMGLLIGTPIEGLGILAGTTIASFVNGNTMVMSQPAQITAGANAIRLLPYGVGDGATTFNLPDTKGRTRVSRDSMGEGGHSNRINGVAFSRPTSSLGAVGGDQWLQVHGHGVNDPAHNHPMTDGGHAHTVFDQSGSYGPNGAGNAYVAVTIASNATGPKNTGASTSNITIYANFTGISIQANGAGGSQNIQPSILTNYIIYAGV